MLFKMDNTSVYTLSIPLLFSVLFGYVHHFSRLYVSNTKMIIRQGDQIQFLLTRIIELDKKIKSIKSDIIIEESECLDEEVVVKEVVVKEVVDEEVVVKEIVDEIVEEVVVKEESECLEKDFELIEPTSTYKISKNDGWLRFIF